MGKMVEIDEAELAANKTLQTLYGEMMGNQKSRTLLEQAVKTVRPNAQTPVADAKAEVLEVVGGVKKQLDEFMAEQRKQREEEEAAKKASDFAAAWEKQKASLRRDGVMEDAIGEIEKLAQERGIPDLEAAAALYSKMHPPQAPAAPNGFGSWNFFEQPKEGSDEFVKKMLETKGEDESSLRQQVNSALNEARGVQRAA